MSCTAPCANRSSSCWCSANAGRRATTQRLVQLLRRQHAQPQNWSLPHLNHTWHAPSLPPARPLKELNLRPPCSHYCAASEEQEARGFGPPTRYPRCLPVARALPGCGRREGQPCCPVHRGNGSEAAPYCRGEDLMCVPGPAFTPSGPGSGVVQNASGVRQPAQVPLGLDVGWAGLRQGALCGRGLASPHTGMSALRPVPFCPCHT